MVSGFSYSDQPKGGGGERGRGDGRGGKGGGEMTGGRKGTGKNRKGGRAREKLQEENQSFVI